MSTVPGASPQYSSVPRPVLPRKPLAWHSSMKTIAPCFSASSQISFMGAMWPSMENTPSVATSLSRQSLASTSLASKSSMSMCL